jgi:hypothetical protein
MIIALLLCCCLGSSFSPGRLVSFRIQAMAVPVDIEEKMSLEVALLHVWQQIWQQCGDVTDANFDAVLNQALDRAAGYASSSELCNAAAKSPDFARRQHSQRPEDIKTDNIHLPRQRSFQNISASSYMVLER